MKLIFRKRAKTKIAVLLIVTTVIVVIFLGYVLNGFMTFTRGINFSVEKVLVSRDIINLVSGKDKIVLQICKPDLINVNFLPKGKKENVTPLIDTKVKWGTGNIISINAQTDPIIIKTKKMVVKINKSPYRLFVYTPSNRLLISDSVGGGITNEGIKLDHSSEDNFYGIGGYDAYENSSEGILRNSGGKVYAGTQGHSGAPFVWSNRGYGILVDSNGGSFDINKATLSYRGVSKLDVDYYIAVGKPSEIMSGISEITGKSPLFPKWAMGFTNTQWGIDENQLNSIVDTYRLKQIPIDNYCLDFDWKSWGKDNYGEFKWNTINFPSGPTGVLKKQMDRKGIKLTGILKPRIHINTMQGDEASKEGWWLEGSKPYQDYFSGDLVNNLDFSRPGLGKWYFNHLKGVFDTGMSGWWNDEADVGYDNFGHFFMEKALYEEQRAYKNQRVWSINRNFYLGAQRYAYGLWSGDIQSGFESMANQRERMLSAINLGEAKWGMDTGGFIGDPTEENYTRWMEFSAFTPIFRVHGHENAIRQPWYYGTIAEEASKKVMQLRYQLLPYIYAYERRAFENGIGLVKPLVFDYPEDRNVSNYKDAWMFGDYLLVAPVVEMEQTSKKIYLPAGTWVDYFKGTVYKGGNTINYPINSVTLKDIPIFVKQGAIIPSQDFMNYVGEKPITKIYMDVFSDSKKTSFQYYDDDGISYDYEKRKYFKQTITVQRSKSAINIKIGKREGSFNPALRYYIYKVHGKLSTSTKVNNIPAHKYRNYSDLVNANNEGWSTGRDIYGEVTYIKVYSGKIKDIEIN